MTFQEFVPFAGWAGIIIGLLFILSAITYVWLEWVNDGELSDDFFLKKFWAGGEDGSIIQCSLLSGLITGGCAFFLMCVGYVAVLFYPVTLSILTLMLISYIARIGIRHRKLFDMHTENKDAHSKEKVT